VIFGLLFALTLGCTGGSEPGPAPSDSGTGGDSGADSGGGPAPSDVVDVLVLGAGGSGLAALDAADAAGASVLALEREETAGGSSVWAALLWGVDTELQANFGIPDTVDLALSEWEGLTGASAEDPWVQDFVAGSSELIDWLDALGIDFRAVTDDPDAGSLPRLHTIPIGEPLPPALLAELHGDQVRTSTTATGLVVDEGAVVGATWTAADGTEGWIAAEAVVVATGGFTRDLDRLATALPELEDGPLGFECVPGMDGNGLDMMEAAGAQLSNLEGVGLYRHATPDPRSDTGEVLMVPGLTLTMIVNGEGDRIADEDLSRSLDFGRLTLGEDAVWAIFDDEQWADLMVQPMPYTSDEPEIIEASELETWTELPSADDLEGLAEALDAPDLPEAVDRYNSLIEGGEDTDFGKALTGCEPLDTPPFHALPLVLTAAKSFGGARLGEGARVLDADGEPIPGLFAAGAAAGMLGGPGAGEGFSGATSAAYFTGRVAGETAAADAVD